MLAEPPPTQADLHFQLLGFPVRIHPWFWLVTLFLGQGYWQPPVMALFWVAGVFLCILLHELGHAVVMRGFGFQPHIVLHAFGGLTGYGGGGFGRRLGPWGQILISIAGPAAGFLLAACIVLGFQAAGHADQIGWGGPAGLVPEVLWAGGWPKTMVFIDIVLRVSVLWGLFNLLPIFPLDGGQIAQQVFLLVAPRDAMRQSLVLSLLVAVALAVVAAMHWHDWYLAIFFGYLAYSNYTMLTFWGGHGRWQ